MNLFGFRIAPLYIYSLSFLLLLSSCKTFDSWGRKKSKNKDTAIATTAKKDSSAKYSDIYKKSIVDSGLFNVIKKEKDYYFDIPVSKLGKDFLLVNKISSVPLAINEAGINKGINFDNKVIRFSINKDRSEVWVSEIKPQIEVPATAAIALSVSANFTDSFIESFKIESYSKDSSSVLVKVNKVFDGSEKSFNDVFTQLGLGTSARTTLSVIETAKSFNGNIVIRSVLSTRVVEGRDALPVSLRVTSNIYELAEKPMVPRFSDPRVGYFTVPRWYFSDEQQELEKRELVTRWRLEPKEEDIRRYLKGELVEPKKPIVFYIDPATPKQWRKDIIAGVHDWQAAFEAAGFKNAIIAKEVTDSLNFDVDDVNISAITYAASPQANAMGPSVVDPRSGEIIEADVIWWHNVMTALNSWMRIQTGTVDSTVRGNVFSDEKMAHAIRFVSSHEIGHTLGLKHNMGSSHSFPVDSLRSPAFTKRMGGTATSIMDYARFNYVAQPGDGVEYITPSIGLYDKYAIAWAYRWYAAENPWEELPKLRREIAKHQDDPHFRYGEQQDYKNVVDPRSQSEDLGDNAMLAGKYGMNNLKLIMPEIINWTTAKGESYEKAGKLYMGVWGQWFTYADHVLNNIGGIYLENPVLGDNKNAYAPVPRNIQVQALDYLKKNVLQIPDWLFDKELVLKTFALRASPIGDFEYAPYDLKREFQYSLLYKMVQDERLLRMTEMELLFGKEQAWSLDSYLTELRKEIFKSTLAGAALTIDARMLQQNYIDVLLVTTNKSMEKLNNRKLNRVTELMAQAKPDLCSIQSHQHTLAGTDVELGAQDKELRNIHVTGMFRTSEMLTAKRAELMNILALLKSSRAGDSMTKAHYQDLILRIENTINK